MTALTLLSVLLLSSVSWTAGTEAKYRLPTTTTPSRYDLHFTPDLENFVFSGTAAITFTVTNATSEIVLNQKDLTIKKITASVDDEATTQTVTHWYIDDNLERLIIFFQKELPANKSATVTINYDGVLNDKKRGFYRSRYFINKKLNYIATTHFEPTGARLAFPCWDEPEYKAVFKISITHSKKYNAVIANTKIDKTEAVNNFTETTHFKDTPKMSTYLVAFVVSDYKFSSDTTGDFKIYTKSDSVSYTEYPLNFSVNAMKQLDLVTGIPYKASMEKMDQISIKDFSAGAMENWGLVTYREKYLWYEKGVTTTQIKESTATTIAHEFTHQWFGNLVSPKWWEYIWLNEGFANYFQYYITDKVEKDWRLMEVFVVDAMQRTAFSFDGQESSRPMNKAVQTPSEISNLFDSIAYQKSGSVIRMLSHVLKEDVFHAGLKKYLTDNKYGVADSDNLVRHLQEAAGVTTWGGKKLEEIVRNWFTKPGYPVVTVKKAGNGQYTLSQRRFLYYGSDNDTKWWIPITYVTKDAFDFDNTTVTHWMDPTKDNLTIDVPNSDWILLNKQQTGYYRVNYDDETWKSLSSYVKDNPKKIHAVNRAQLLDDAFNLARTDMVRYETALSFTMYLRNETDYIPWKTTFRNLNFLHNILFNSKQYKIFQAYIKYIMQGLTKLVKYEPSDNDSHVTKLLKATAIKWGCLAGVEECKVYAKKEFQAWFKDPKHKLDADLKNSILCFGLKSADEKTWNSTRDTLAESEFDKDERNTLLAAMGCSTKEKILHNLLLDSAKPNATVDFDVVAAAIISNHPSGVDIVLDVLEKQSAALVKMDDFESRMSTTISALGSAIVKQEDYLKLSQFCVKIGAKADVVKNAVEKATRNINWVKTYSKTVEKWLIDNENTFNSSGALTFTSFLLLLSIFITRLY